MKFDAQQKTLDLRRGLFLIKYEQAGDLTRPPQITLTAAPSDEAYVEIVLPPDEDSAVLWKPGAAIVAKVKRQCRLLIDISPSVGSRSVEASLQAIPLSTEPGGRGSHRPELDDLNFSEFRLLGHVSRRGDTRVVMDEWLGGPIAPARIEGLAVEWPSLPRGLTLKYGARFADGVASGADLVDVGTFVGTRGRARPLVGVTFQLSGAQAHDYHLVVDAIFLGSPQMRATGQIVVLSGPTGREPLIGLRMQIGNQNAPLERPTLDSGHLISTAPISAKATGGRVRVFRSTGSK